MIKMKSIKIIGIVIIILVFVIGCHTKTQIHNYDSNDIKKETQTTSQIEKESIDDNKVTTEKDDLKDQNNAVEHKINVTNEINDIFAEVDIEPPSIPN